MKTRFTVCGQEVKNKKRMRLVAAASVLSCDIVDRQKTFLNVKLRMVASQACDKHPVSRLRNEHKEREMNKI